MLEFSPSHFSKVLQPKNKEPCTLAECSACQHRFRCDKYTKLLEDLIVIQIQQESKLAQTTQSLEENQVSQIVQPVESTQLVKTNQSIDPIISILESLTNKIEELDNRLNAIVNTKIEDPIINDKNVDTIEKNEAPEKLENNIIIQEEKVSELSVVPYDSKNKGVVLQEKLSLFTRKPTGKFREVKK